jgi:hypothetical protein
MWSPMSEVQHIFSELVVASAAICVLRDSLTVLQFAVPDKRIISFSPVKPLQLSRY